MSARRGRCALSRRACHLAPAPAAQASGALRRALPPLFCLDLGRRGSSSLVGPSPPTCVPARMRLRAPRPPIGCGLAHAQRPVARLPPRPPLSLLSTVSKPVRRMPAVVIGCGGPPLRVLRPRRGRHYGAPSGECAELRPRGALPSLRRWDGGAVAASSRRRRRPSAAPRPSRLPLPRSALSRGRSRLCFRCSSRRCSVSVGAVALLPPPPPLP